MHSWRKICVSALLLLTAFSAFAKDGKIKQHTYTKEEIKNLESERAGDKQRVDALEAKLNKDEVELEDLRKVGDPAKIAEMQAEVQKHTLYFQIVIGLVGIIAAALIGELMRRTFAKTKTSEA